MAITNGEYVTALYNKDVEYQAGRIGATRAEFEKWVRGIFESWMDG